MRAFIINAFNAILDNAVAIFAVASPVVTVVAFIA